MTATKSAELGPWSHVTYPVRCARDPLRGVSEAYRLRVIDPSCQRFTGTVRSVRHQKDGDVQVDVVPQPGYDWTFLAPANHGALVVEIMPGQKLPIPLAGEKVTVFGTWVLDTDHAWGEIHPVWGITYLDTGVTITSWPPKTPWYKPQSHFRQQRSLA